MYMEGRSDNSSSPASLVELCCISLAKAISCGACDRDSISNLPGELSERLLAAMSAQSLLTNESLLYIASPNLRFLNVSNVKQRENHPNEGGLERAIQVCTGIEELNCHGCRLGESLLLRVAATPFLKVLDLSHSCGVTSESLRIILRSCASLAHLNVSGCPEVADDAFDVLPACLPIQRSVRENSLKRKLDTSDDFSFLSDLMETPPRQVKKAKLAPSSSEICEPIVCPQIPDATILTNMRELNISGCCSITNKGLDLISRIFPYLSRLDCSHIDTNLNMNIHPILNRCSFIKAVNINGCKLDQTHSFISNPALALQEISYCGTGVLNHHFQALLYHCAKYLRVVRLRNKIFCTDRMDELNIPGPTSWLQNCQRLVTLDLYSVSLDESALPRLLSTPCVETLEVLDLTHCHVSDKDLKILCHTQLPHLRSLSLHQVSISNWTMELGRNCPNLTQLCMNLDLKGLLPETSVPQLLNGLVNLRELELWCCKSLSLPTVKLILHMCPSLNCLLLSTANPEPGENRINAENVEGDDDSDWSEEEEEEVQKSTDDHAHHSHGAASWLSDREFSWLTHTYPNVQLKLWHHTISGNRHFRYYNGDPSSQQRDSLTPLNVNHLGVRLRVNVQEGGPNEIVPTILVDNIPIWSHETSASLHHLRKTTDGHDGGALPLISEWCCDCNIESYNGVLFYHDADYVFWETHEPGEKQRFRFSKGQYISAINNARLQYMQLVWKLQRQQQWQQQLSRQAQPILSQ